MESFTPTFGLGTPVFLRISSNLHCGTPTFSKRCLWDPYFQNPSENPEGSKFLPLRVDPTEKGGRAENDSADYRIFLLIPNWFKQYLFENLHKYVIYRVHGIGFGRKH